jgi:predicted glycogen debranching enzyme
MIRFGEELCHDLDAATQREWLETNGIGGFASSTVSGANTRRYHGLLTAALRPPVGRQTLLSKLEETLIVDGRRYELSTNCYEPLVIHPEGYRITREFRLDPFPVFVFAFEGVEIEKSIFMIHGENSVVVQYALRNAGGRTVNMEIRPLIAFRDFHALTHQNGALDARVDLGESTASVAPYAGLPALHFAHDAQRVYPDGCWYRNFRYDRERERGLDASEDLYNPFTLYFDLSGRPTVSVIASTEPHDVRQVDAYRQAEIARRRAVVESSPSKDEFVTALVAAADQFVVRRGKRSSIIAGYHWFADWGRDTMIALPGLTLCTGRREEARGILLEYAACIDRGMLPNRFPDAGQPPEYNSIDATLWYFEAIRALEEPDFVCENLYGKLKEIVDWFERGSRYGIHVDSDGLLSAGESGVQLTWMDAKVGDWVVTPRIGKPVEVQALWYNALCILEDFARQFGDAEAARYAQMADAAAASFCPLFWNPESNCLYDVIAPDGAPDASLRPNQIFAVSLPYSMLAADRARQVVDLVRRELFTPGGLRTLAPGDPAYRGRYEGDPRSRDGAYHQGTVWPWLMGPFITAYLKTHGEAGRAQAKTWIAGFNGHLTQAGLGQISEIYDGDFPEEPRGAIAQAWSVAELLRAALEVIQ